MLEKVSNTEKALLGWILICLVSAFSGGLWNGVGLFLFGIGVYFLFSPLVEWLRNENQ